MTTRTPRTLDHLKHLYSARSSYAYDLTFDWHWMKEVIDGWEAEREVSRNLAEALGLIPTDIMRAVGPPYNVKFSLNAFDQICSALAQYNAQSKSAHQPKDSKV